MGQYLCCLLYAQWFTSHNSFNFISFMVSISSYTMFFLACVFVLSCFSHVWLCVTPWAIVLQAPLFTEFSRQEYWNGLTCPPPGNLSDPGIELSSLKSPALVGRFFTWVLLNITPLLPGIGCFWWRNMRLTWTFSPWCDRSFLSGWLEDLHFTLEV